MSFEVFLTEDAAADLAELYAYIATSDSPASADSVLSKIEKVVTGLSELPERGNHPPELLELGIREYRERFFKPYRIIYRMLGDKIYVLLIADGRRNMQSLLEHRLLSG